MKVIGYRRVSTEEQSKDGVSLEIQNEKIRLYCQLHGHDLIRIETDAGETGKDLKRDGIQKCLDALRNHEADGLVVSKLCRLTRSTRDWAHLIETVFTGKLSAALMSVEESIDTGTAAGRMLLNLLITVYQWEREVISERTRSALKHKKSIGERVGGIPYGKRLENPGLSGADALVDDADEQLIIGKIQSMRVLGLSFQKIAAHLNETGVATKNKGKKYGSRTVAGVWTAKGVFKVAGANHVPLEIVALGGQQCSL